jgi:hypothetical protein
VTGHPTRVHLLACLAHVLAAAHLAAAAYLAAVCAAIRRVADADADAVRGLRDAAWAAAAARRAAAPPPPPTRAAPRSGPTEPGLPASPVEAPLPLLPVRMPAHPAGSEPARRDFAGPCAPSESLVPEVAAGPAGKQELSAAAAAMGWREAEGLHPDARALAQLLAAAAGAGGGGVRESLLWGLARVGRDNAAAWREHVAAFDVALRAAGPALCAAAAAWILCGGADAELPG